MPTRVVHRVRCRHKTNNQIWADVKVIDALTIIAPDGQEILYWTKAKDCNPFIKDETGDDNGKGDAGSCTRVSHMVQIKDPDDDKNIMDVEVLDAFALLPPSVSEADEGFPPSGDQDKRRGLIRGSVFGKGPMVLTMQDSKAVKLTVDKTGLGLDDGSSSVCSRSGHVSLVTEKGNTDDQTDGIDDAGDSIPPKKLAWCSVVKPDAINFQIGGSNITILMPNQPNLKPVDEVDTTEETTDPVTGDPCPPDNDDPNHYVKFPDKAIGASVKTPAGQPNNDPGPINQGILWWIEKVSPGFNPWFWFAKVQSPQAFSFFGAPGNLGSWPWRGFVLWNNYPVIWILSRNNPLSPMGNFGSGSLDLCATKGDWDSSYPAVPSNPFLAPPHHVSLFPFSGLSFVPPDFLAGATPDPTFGPFGALPMSYPPLNHPVVAGLASKPLNKGRPNVWELTGKTQPPLLNPDKPFNMVPGKNFNPFTLPSKKDAEDAAKDFRDKWNSAANGHNAAIKAYVPSGNRGGGYGAGGPPGWKWSVPYFDNIIPANRFAFQNGIPPGISQDGIPLVVYTPATSWTMDVDTLDTKKWDATHLEYYNNPLNFFFTTVLQPFPWDNDPWIKSGKYADPK